jgi:hypothetical protein
MMFDIVRHDPSSERQLSDSPPQPRAPRLAIACRAIENEGLDSHDLEAMGLRRQPQGSVVSRHDCIETRRLLP